MAKGSGTWAEVGTRGKGEERVRIEVRRHGLRHVRSTGSACLGRGCSTVGEEPLWPAAIARRPLACLDVTPAATRGRDATESCTRSHYSRTERKGAGSTGRLLKPTLVRRRAHLGAL